MAHPEQRSFFAALRASMPDMFTGQRVLEVGSLDINGTVRDFFTDCDYTGVDVGPGPGVDMVVAGQDLAFPDNSFDVVVSAECFEHNPEWLATFANMVRMCRRVVVFTCATTGREEHGTSRSHPLASPHTLDWDYYRNLSIDDFTDAFNFADRFTVYRFEVNESSHDLYFVGIIKENT